MMEKRKIGYLPCLLAPLAVGALLLCVYALRGLYPFGGNTLITGDLQQTYAAMYEQFADILNGKQSFFYSFQTGLGIPLSSDTMTGSFLSPLNLLLLLVPEGGMLRFLSYFVLLKLMLCGLSGSWYFVKRFPKLPAFYAVFFGVCYGLSGYVLVQYHNIIWMETVALTPVLLYYTEKLLTGGKLLPYVLLLGYMMLLQYYLTGMVCVFIFLVGGAYILFLLPKGQRGKATLRIAVGTVLALLISAAAYGPSLLQLTGAARMSRENSGVLTAFTGYSFSRGMALCTMAFGLVLIPRYFYRLRHSGEKNRLTFGLVSLGLMLLPLFIDGTDNLWHFGGHIAFPYRYGFLTVFLVLALCAAGVCEENADVSRAAWAKRSKGGKALLFVATAGLFLVFCYLMVRYGRKINTYLDWMNGRLLLMTLATAALYGLLMFWPEGKGLKALLACALCIQTLAYGVSCIPPEDPAITLNDASATKAMALRSCFAASGPLIRVKNEDASLTLNYGRFLGQPTLSAFSSSTSQALMDAMRGLGYGVSTYSIQDCGGTLFSDAFFAEQHMISPTSRFREDGAYSFSGSAGDYAVYDCTYTLPFGMVGTSALEGLDAADGSTCLDRQNQLYQALARTEDLLIETAALSEWTDVGSGTYVYVIPVTGMKRLYAVNVKDPRVPLHAAVHADGRETVSTVPHTQVYYDGITDFGTYTDETVTFTFFAGEDAKPEDIQIGLMDMEKLDALCKTASEKGTVAGKRSLTLQAVAKADGDVLLAPLQYNAGWRCTVDGQPAETVAVMDALLGVELTEGTHEVTFRYATPGFTACLALSALGLLLAALVWLYEYKKRREPLLADVPEKTEKALSGLMWVCWCGAVLLVYALPTAYALLTGFQQLGN